MNRKKRKSSGFFSYDGDFYYYASKVFDVVVLGILWLIGCIPIITVGASFTALHYAMYHSVKKDEEGFGKCFWKAYRRNFKESVPIWLIILAVVLLMLLNIGVMYREFNTNAGLFMLILYAVVLVYFNLTGAYIFAALARFDMPVGWLFRLSFTMVFRHLPFSLVLGAVLLGSYLIVLNYPMLILFVPGPAAWICSLMTDPLLERYMPDPDEDDGGKAKGDQTTPVDKKKEN